MEIIISFIDQILQTLGLEGSTIAIVRHTSMVIVAFLLAWLSGVFCRRIIVPLVIKLTSKTNTEWDSVMFDRQVLRTAANIVPAIVMWELLPKVFFLYPFVEETLTRLTAVYICINTTRLVLQLVDRLRFLDKRTGSSTSQYFKSFLGILKIIVLFITVIIVVSILFDKNPMTLLAGLGATSAVLMLVFKDTIEGLVAGIRLTSNEMVHVGDWITVPNTPVDGNVVDITLTTVKVRQFDNTYTTVSPLTLVNGSFKNWKGMQESGMRQVAKKIYFDARSFKLIDNKMREDLIVRNIVTEEQIKDEDVNIGLFRHYMEDYLRKRKEINSNMMIMVRQLEATQSGIPIELYFFINTTEWLNYEQIVSDVLEHVYASANEFGLQLYQMFPKQ